MQTGNAETVLTAACKLAAPRCDLFTSPFRLCALAAGASEDLGSATT